jgi:putative acetyltransferase
VRLAPASKTMIELKRTTSDDADFQSLVKLLDRDLEIKNGSEHSFYAQYNKIDAIKNAVVYYNNGIAIGCGAFKGYDKATVEIKRMFVQPEFRGKGVGAKILNELEQWAAEINYTAAILETGKKQPEAIALYKKAAYEIIPNFGQYAGVENSVCMKKMLHN